MVIDLSEVFVNDAARVSIAHELDMSSVDFRGEFPLKVPVKITGSVFSRASVVSLQAELRFTYSSLCDRCGRETEKAVSVPLEKALVVSIEGEENEGILLVPDRKLDVDELIFTETVLHLPTKLLCREDCKGVCPKCGKDLNEGACGCSQKEIDPRLQKLADLLQDQKDMD